jgi:hypothetical protein
MADILDAKSKLSLGIQAYRWITAAGIAVLVLLSNRTLQGIDQTAEAVRAMQIELRTMQGTTESRFNAHAGRLDAVDRRNDLQDSKIDGLWQRFWTFPQSPPPKAPRE